MYALNHFKSYTEVLKMIKWFETISLGSKTTNSGVILETQLMALVCKMWKKQTELSHRINSFEL